jgi:threonyl-tRNA synthetase
VEERSVSVRSRHKASQDTLKLEEFVEKVVAESKAPK